MPVLFCSLMLMARLVQFREMTSPNSEICLFEKFCQVKFFCALKSDLEHLEYLGVFSVDFRQKCVGVMSWRRAIQRAIGRGVARRRWRDTRRESGRKMVRGSKVCEVAGNNGPQPSTLFYMSTHHGINIVSAEIFGAIFRGAFFCVKAM